MHWRVLASIMNNTGINLDGWTDKQRRRDGNEAGTVAISSVTIRSGKSGEGSTTLLPITGKGFVDSHFHLDAMQKRAGIRNFNTLLEKGPGYSDRFVLEFAVTCYSSLVPPVSQLQNPDSRLRFTFGLHPKEVFKYDSTRVTQVLRAAETAPYSVGLGEIGLDYTGRHLDYADAQLQTF
jgi:hypothetical protein